MQPFPFLSLPSSPRSFSSLSIFPPDPSLTYLCNKHCIAPVVLPRPPRRYCYLPYLTWVPSYCHWVADNSTTQSEHHCLIPLDNQDPSRLICAPINAAPTRSRTDETKGPSQGRRKKKKKKTGGSKGGSKHHLSRERRTAQHRSSHS
ncbi:hypothetical protein GQ607_007403 [Colletotrichum asianum]|uniref:Uncharacterized protein n=1 Tax=Colletotrichum asianum TaxID=702518 RepID=A0A8H3WE75_9PEZI|nr:hypothetical protein GQ607_007403 [Colletotrichum asianum]